MPAPFPVRGPAGPPPFLPFEAALPIPGSPRGTTATAVHAGTTYYVDSVNGNDANNGKGPDASDATNKPWKTIAKLLGASGMASGDIAYLSPAGPFRENVTIAMTNPTVETRVFGDPANAQGFKTAAGALVTGGDVVWTAYTTNDKTGPAGAACVTLAGRSHLTFQDVMLIGGGTASSCYDATTTGSQYITWRRVVMLPNGAGNPSYCGRLTLGQDQPAHWLFDSVIYTPGNTLQGHLITAPRPFGGELDIDYTMVNCKSIGALPPAFTVSAGGAVFKWGGVRYLNCTFMAATNMFSPPANYSTLIPLYVYNCVCLGGGNTCFNANTAGQIVEDGNLIVGFSVQRTNTGIGPTSQTNWSPSIEIGQAELFGRQIAPFFAPSPGSVLVGMGGVDALTIPDLDLDGYTRPQGGTPTTRTPGALLRSNNFVQQTATTQAGASAISVTGSGAADFNLPVDATPITVSIYCQFDSNYVGPLPQLQIVNGQECGIANQAVSFTKNAQGAFELQSLTIAPLRKGIVTVRVVASDTSGLSVTIFDTMNAA